MPPILESMTYQWLAATGKDQPAPPRPPREVIRRAAMAEERWHTVPCSQIPRETVSQEVASTNVSIVMMELANCHPSHETRRLNRWQTSQSFSRPDTSTIVEEWSSLGCLLLACSAGTRGINQQEPWRGPCAPLFPCVGGGKYVLPQLGEPRINGKKATPNFSKDGRGITQLLLLLVGIRTWENLWRRIVF